ncbi:tetratricopeptide repeat protein [Vibrio crassostreae]|uniref:tetratricopeptide repeat protein n=1 Tax=Vibrio crassostreae TaxID=246167 RepID=UPI001B30390D|nr:hypothetical protein [Vibrio crassostreae]CAK1706249.1 conserved hypothetical protein [Vibrio crassostreae]CAK2384230.1 conserved hypothetical protein [Vibrio crassostreae]CAK2444436.1 conserved hypothetical protein [Vibrio crassostreae]CAK2556403.1 conserved hypothetical protein [Vibrio crassostreae]CAK2562826.1 conserved hypothetical protein [Vibrio crassostreae]
MQIAPQSKVNEILSSLMEAVSSSTVLSEFEIAYYKREAEKLPEASHTHLTLTILYTSLKQQKQALLHAHEAIRLAPDDQVILGNIIWALSFVGAAKTVYELIKKIPTEICTGKVLENILVASHFFNDLELTEGLLKQLESEQPDASRYKSELAHFQTKMNNIACAKQRINFSENDFLELSLLALELVERSPNINAVSSYIYALPESDKICLSFEVNCEPEAIFDLNWELSQLITETNLMSSPVIARFDVADNNHELTRSGGF